MYVSFTFYQFSRHSLDNQFKDFTITGKLLKNQHERRDNFYLINKSGVVLKLAHNPSPTFNYDRVTYKG